MHNPLTVSDALAVLKRSSLPTVITEGKTDYRVMRKVEERLSDIGVDFLPLSGKSTVLEVWSQIPSHRAKNTIALVDLDDWLYCGIPDEYSGENIMYTVGYSIENDLLLDTPAENLLENQENTDFFKELDVICAEHSRQIERCKSGQQFHLKRHASEIVNAGDISQTLAPNEQATNLVLKANFRQMVRGKTLFQLLVRQLSRPQRHTKIGYKQLNEFASMTPGKIFVQFEKKVRTFFPI